jgi:hypothetical protein
LSTIAQLLARQGGAPRPQQVDYLNAVLFGTMGSLQDFTLDVELNPEAREANRELGRLREELYQQFEHLGDDDHCQPKVGARGTDMSERHMTTSACWPSSGRQS